jgi:hypothetical protein
MSVPARPLQALTLAALLVAGTAAAEPLLLASHADPGPNVSPVGRSAFAELFGLEPDAPAANLPFPFERLVEAVAELIAPAEPTGVLVPLGRSLQRHAADRNYFAAPRVVVAVTEDPAAGPERPFLADRLFLGFHAEAHVIEIVSYNEDAGRFEFEVVEDYGPGLVPQLVRGERFVCTACHQGHAPIFADPLWSETGADRRVAARLAALGPDYEGVATRSGTDRSDAVDRSTDRATRIAFADFVWREGCEPPQVAACRGELLLRALRFRLAGARSPWQPTADDAVLAGKLAARLAGLARDGVAVPAPDLANRDPMSEIEAGVPPHEAVAPDTAAEPTEPHPPLLFWHPDEGADALLSRAVQDIASWFSAADIAWLDRRLARTPAAHRLVALTPCVGLQAGGELRFDCGERLSGYLAADGSGAVRLLQLSGQAPVHRLRIVATHRDGPALRLDLREAAHGLNARLLTGERLGPLLLRLDDRAALIAAVVVTDDTAPLQDAVTSMIARAASDPDAALGAGPPRRRAVLAELAAALGPVAERSG